MKRTVKRPTVKGKTARSSRAADLLKKGRRKLKDLQPVWERARKQLGETAEAAGKGAEKAVAKTVTMATLASLKFRIRGQKLDLKDQMADLGAWVYELATRNPQALGPTDSEIIDMVARIRDKEKEIADLEEKAKALRK